MITSFIMHEQGGAEAEMELQELSLTPALSLPPRVGREREQFTGLMDRMCRAGQFVLVLSVRGGPGCQRSSMGFRFRAESCYGAFRKPF